MQSWHWAADDAELCRRFEHEPRFVEIAAEPLRQREQQRRLGDRARAPAELLEQAWEQLRVQPSGNARRR